jgi:hypothetical protein
MAVKREDFHDAIPHGLSLEYLFDWNTRHVDRLDPMESADSLL